MMMMLLRLLFTVAALLSLPAVDSFSVHSSLPHSRTRTVRTNRNLFAQPAEDADVAIALWMLAFSSSHIGMSAVRNTIIDSLGTIADDQLNLVNRGWKLPDIWPGDDVGGQEIFPSPDIAGRQIYRVVYTAISFTTLGSAFLLYLSSLHEAPVVEWQDSQLLHSVAALSWGCSIASLFNPSPLSLVPVYEPQLGGSKTEDASALLIRQDSQKLMASGMTRITRHPLILPVVPWAVATALSMGGLPRDYALFVPLALYAMAGCGAQDLRVTRQEGSVGTVFEPGTSLQDFFEETSFWPFGAVIDGRQSLSTVVREFPWLGLVVGTGIGYKMQGVLLEWLMNQ